MEASSSSQPPSSPPMSPRERTRLSLSPELLRPFGRRISEQRTTHLEVDTILEETEEEEEEKEEIEPCNYENLFVTIGGRRFYRKRPPKGSPPSSDGASIVSVAGFRAPSSPTSPAGPAPRMNYEVRGEDESDLGQDNDQSINPHSLLEHHDAGDRNSFRPDYPESSRKSLVWSQFKAILSKNFKLYSSVDIYLLAVLIVFGMLIIPYQYSVVKEAKAKSYHSWHLEFPGSFGFLKSQSARFWMKMMTGNDQLTREAAEEVVNESFGTDFTDVLFGHDDEDEYTTNVLYNEKSKSSAKEAERSFLNLQDDIMQMGRRLMRHPVPTPSLNQYILIHNMQGLAKEHFNQKYPALGTLHITPPFPDFVDYLGELLGDPARVCYDRRYSGCDVLLRDHETSSAAMDFILKDSEPTWALLDFSDWDNEYVIRMDPENLPSTPIGETALATSDEYQLYFTSGFLTLQKTIDEYAFVVADRTADNNCYRKALRQTMVFMPMPTHAFAHNTYLPTYGFLIGLTCIAALLAPIARLVLAMVSEKEAKLQSMITVAGVPRWLINVSWLSFAMILFSAISLSGAVLLKLSLLSHIPFWKLAIWMACSGISAASFAFAFGIVFEQAKLSAALAPALFLATALPRFIVFGIQQDGMTFHYYFALFPGSAICFGVDSLLREHGEATPEETIRLWRVIVFLLLDSVAALTIGFLISSVDVATESQRFMKSLGGRKVLSDDGSVTSQESTSTPVSEQ
jgi:ABC-2 family transporter protein